MKASKVQNELLAWYDGHARELPWRAKPGVHADPYAVWLSEIMLQQTTVATVGPYFEKFLTTWPTVKDLADAQLDEVLAAWAGLGYYSRARNLHKCAQVVAFERDGEFPATQAELIRLPGVGPYTSAAIAAIAFGEAAAVVDGNVERVLTRLFNSPIPLAKNKDQLRAWAAELTPYKRPGDYAQAMMDLGATICRPKNPQCLLCPLTDHCAAQKAGTARDLPTKLEKAPKPVRRGYAYLIEAPDGQLLIDKRPPKGLLGGMDGLPTSPWSDELSDPLPGSEDLGLEVKHTFTHFHLYLHLCKGSANLAPEFPEARFVSDLSTLALPTLFLKALKAANRAP